MKLTKREVAEQICSLYHEAIRSEVAKATRASSTRVMPSRKLDEVDKSTRRAFLAAARACMELGADPREYIVGQFSAWREASAYHKKLMWPSPQHLGTLGARVRFLQFKAREATRSARVTVVEEQVDEGRWFVEERKLRGMARMQRRDPVDVLTEQPEEFSRAFLKYKKVWNVVKDLWEEREQS